MSEPLPKLQLVALSHCALHESFDPPRVARLAARLRADDVLRNPPIVARVPATDRYVVLDGATRTTALRQLGYESSPAQIVSYSDPRIELHTWAHVLHGVAPAPLLRWIRAIDGLMLHRIALESALQHVHERAFIGSLVTADGEAWAIEGGGSLRDEARLLDEVFHCYARCATVQRLPHDARFTVTSLPAGTVAAIFPRYTKQDLLDLVGEEGVLPGGITRHTIPGRALRVNVPLAPLREGTYESQQRWFAAWIAERVAGGHARLYTEPTWLFDE
jgi:L-serine kinase (ATP) / ParB family transcriptional regulator, heme-responsive regulator